MNEDNKNNQNNQTGNYNNGEMNHNFTGSYNNNISMGNLNIVNPSRKSTENSQDILKVSKDFVEDIFKETKKNQGLV